MRSILLHQRLKQALKTVTLTIKADSSTDPYARYHGRAVDEDLPEGFWTKDGGKYTKGQSPYGSPHWSYTETLELPVGEHRVTYGNSANAGYMWDATVTVNGASKTGSVDRHNYLTLTFTVQEAPPPPPTPIPWQTILLGTVLIGGGAGALYLATRKKPIILPAFLAR